MQRLAFECKGAYSTFFKRMCNTQLPDDLFNSYGNWLIEQYKSDVDPYDSAMEAQVHYPPEEREFVVNTFGDFFMDMHEVFKDIEMRFQMELPEGCFVEWRLPDVMILQFP